MSNNESRNGVVGEFPARIGFLKPLAQWGREDRRQAIVILGLTLCVGFVAPIYYFELTSTTRLTFSLFQLLTESETYRVSSDGSAAYIIYLLLPALTVFLAQHGGGKWLSRALIPSSLYLLLFFASRHVTLEEDYAKYFGLSVLGWAYLLVLVAVTLACAWELLESRGRHVPVEKVKLGEVVEGALPRERREEYVRTATEAARGAARQVRGILDASLGEHAQLETVSPAHEIAPEESDARFCSRCGMPLKPGAHFCGECGSPVK